eukprot:CAMPEP_0172304700 /NCGR_PEP_ID=MMETSP1058-20130122/6089_1 /TAXON_ID=83371 /ORGANISM="Detonula confervacea, Strain CCMP 353" /LENGTH=38 /DNA_ID= /DNA_START= /DNA_END= /DNA_ORIENTATION=
MASFRTAICHLGIDHVDGDDERRGRRSNDGEDGNGAGA